MDLAYDRAPYLFSVAATLKSFKVKTEGVVPSWKPSKKELEDGKATDKDGNIYIADEVGEALDIRRRERGVPRTSREAAAHHRQKY